MRLAFGDCVFDSETRELRRCGEPVHLAPREFRLLELLLESRPKAISKEELHRGLWPDVHVSDASLTNLVGRVRAAIGDDPRQWHLLRTVYGFGYAFGGTAHDLGADSPQSPATVFRLVWGEREITLRSGENILGRVPEAVVWVHDEKVSRRHARITVAGHEAILDDLGSKNGTLRCGERIRGPVRLCDGDEIRLGSASLILRIYLQPQSTVTNLASY